MRMNSNSCLSVRSYGWFLFLLSLFYYVHFSLSNCLSPYEIFDAKSSTCICHSGFGGWNCRMCNYQINSSLVNMCSSIDSSLHCHSGFSYLNTSEIKTYDCALDSSLESLFEDGAIAVKCNRTSSSCDFAVYKRKKTISSEHVIDCAATGCNFISESPVVNCTKIMCKCGSECAALTKTIVEKVMSGNPVKMTCTGISCDINIHKSPISLRGICNASECVIGNSSIPSDNNSRHNIWRIVFFYIFLPILLLTLLYCALCIPNEEKTRINLRLETKTNPVTTLEFINLCCTKKNKSILKNISGRVTRGHVFGLLGPSGSGKTTLLNALADVRYGNVLVSGNILVDSFPRRRSYRRIAAYVYQEDDLISTLTSRECIQYSAYLRLPGYMTNEEIELRIDNTISELGLTLVKDCLVGNTWGKIRGVSGGERRRISIGMELVNSPAILFLDEPTSGLDSHTANSILFTLSELAKHGRIVVLSVHQPSAKAFMQLDHVLLLSKGQAIYSGSPSAAADTFEAAGYACPKGENIADHMLDVACSNEGRIAMLKLFEEKSPPAPPCLYVNSEQAAFTKVPSDFQSENCAMLRRNDSDIYDCDEERISLLREVKILFGRTAINIIRHPSLLFMHLGVATVLALGGGLVFYKVTNDLAGFQNRTGAFYFILTFFGFFSFSSMDLFIRERSIFIRESGAKYYGAFSYFVAKSSLDSITLRIFPCLVFGCIFYWLMQLKADFVSFIIFLCAITLFTLVSGALCMCISIFSSTVGSANLISTVVFLIMLLFGGFLLNIQTMPKGVAWLKYISCFNYAFEIMMTNELLGIDLTFDAPGYPKVPVKGEVFLATLGMDYRNIPLDLISLAVMFIGYLSLGYFLLLLRVPKSDHCNSICERKVKNFSNSNESANVDAFA